MTVPGVPQPEGSMKGFAIKGRGVRLVHANANGLAAWRHALTSTAADLWGDAPLLDGPVAVDITFRLPRPPSTPRKRLRPAVRPDLDKLERAVLDSLTGVVLVDDSRVCELTGRKVYADGEAPGATVDVWPLDGAGD
jgi:crossover junction endodeoxyribonuclease RusA